MQSAAPTSEPETTREMIEPQATRATAPVRFPRVFFALVAMQFVFGLAVSTFTLLPSVVVRHLRGDSNDVGAYSGALALGSLVAAPFAGFLLDRVGRRRVIAGASFAASISAFFFAATLDSRALSLPMVFASGVAFVFVVNGISALVADVAPEQSLAQAIGWQGAATMVSGAISPTLAEEFAPTHGWQMPFYVASAIVGLLGFAALALPRESAPARPDGGVRASTLTGLRALAPQLVVALLAGAAFTTIATFHQPHFLERGATSVRDYFLGFSAGALVMRLGFGSLPDRLGLVRANRVTLIGYALASLSFCVLPASALIVGGLAHGVVHGMFYPSAIALAFRIVGPRARGLAASFTLGAFNGGSALAAVLLGALARHTSTTWVFVVGACASLLAVAFVREPAAQRGTSTV